MGREGGAAKPNQGRGGSTKPQGGVGQRTQLAYRALVENDQSSEEAGYVRCATWIIPCGVSSIQCFFKALGRASTKTLMLKARHSSFLRPESGSCREQGAEKEMDAIW